MTNLSVQENVAERAEIKRFIHEAETQAKFCNVNVDTYLLAKIYLLLTSKTENK